MKVVHLAFNQYTEESLATAGKEHVAFCVLDGKTLTKTMGKSKGGTVDSMCGIAWSASPDTKDVCFSGSNTGQVVQW